MAGGLHSGHGRELADWAHERLSARGALIAAVDLTASDGDLATLRQRLEGLFARVDLYFPYPDHRQPDCVLAEAFFQRVDARDLVAGYAAGDQRAAIERTPPEALPGLADSVLVVARVAATLTLGFPQLGVMYGRRRPVAPALEAKTRFVETDDGVRSVKTNLSGESSATVGELTHHPCNDPWIPGHSLQSELLQRAAVSQADFDTIFEPARLWLQALEQRAQRYGDTYWLPGRYLDATWQNTFIQARHCHFIDLEWEWHESIRLRVLLIRSMAYLLDEAQRRGGAATPRLLVAARKRLMCRIARSLGVRLDKRDFADYARIDAAFYVLLEGGNPNRARLYGRLKLYNGNVFNLVTATGGWLGRLLVGLRQAAGGARE